MAEVVSVSGSDLEVLRDTRDALARAFGDRLEARRTFCKLINVAGHRLGTKEIESASLLVEEVAEAAVVPARDEIKGRTPDLYVSLKPGLKASQEIRKRVEESVVREIGPIARPRRVMIVPDMPKTRSGRHKCSPTFCRPSPGLSAPARLGRSGAQSSAASETGRGMLRCGKSSAVQRSGAVNRPL
jgi:hypothetical protein